MGGIEPARDYVLDALRAGKPVVTANKQLLAQHGDELFAVAREAGVQLRFEAAVAGGDPDRPRDPGELRRRPRSPRSSGSSTAPPTSSSARWPRPAPATTRCWPAPRSSATPRPTRPRTSTAPTRRRRWRSSPASPSTRRSRSTEVPYEGIEAIQPDDLAYAKELGLSLKLLGVAERRDGGISVRVFPCFLYRRPPAGAGRGPLQRGHGRGAGDHRGDDVGAGRRGPADRLGGARRRRLDPRRRRAGARDPRASCRSSPTSPPPSTCTSRSPTGPACWPRSPRCSATTRSRSRASSSAGIGDDARLVMVVHECLESRFEAAVEGSPSSTSCARRRASIRVIEEEFV